MREIRPSGLGGRGGVSISSPTLIARDPAPRYFAPLADFFAARDEASTTKPKSPQRARIIRVERQQQIPRAGDFLVDRRQQGVARAVGLFEILLQLLGRVIEARGRGDARPDRGPTQILERRRRGEGGVFGEDGGGQFQALARIAGDGNTWFCNKYAKFRDLAGQHGDAFQKPCGCQAPFCHS